MSATASVHQQQARAGAEWMSFGPPPSPEDADAPAIEIASTFGAYEAEYAAIRRHVGIMALPQRGLIELQGADRADFLHRMITHDVNGLEPGQCRRAFMLNEKGRITADMIVIHAADRTLLDLDVHDAAELVDRLNAKLFAEDVAVRDRSSEFEHLALHGPAAIQLLNRVMQDHVTTFEPMTQQQVRWDDRPMVAYRRDDAGSLGLHLLVASDHAGPLYARLLDAAGFESDVADVANVTDAAAFAQRRRQSLRGRPIGWLAYNTARIEAGTALFHIDFGTDSLPGETGSTVLEETVSFTKGCYVGQEIVARMRNLGHPKRVLVGLKMPGEALPVAGTQLIDPADGSSIVGGVTSSTHSPLRGGAAIAFGVVKWARHTADTPLLVAADGQLIEARTHSLRFLESQ